MTPKQIAKFNDILKFDEETAILHNDIERSSVEDAEKIYAELEDRAKFRKTYFYAISPSSSTIQPIDLDKDGRDDDTNKEMPGITIGSDVTYYKVKDEGERLKEEIERFDRWWDSRAGDTDPSISDFIDWYDSESITQRKRRDRNMPPR